MPKLIKCTVRTSNGSIFECELTEKTISEQKKEYLVSVQKRG